MKEEYKLYLEYFLEKGRINKGEYSLLLISKDAYNSFLNKVEHSKYIIKIINLMKRDKLIKSIID